MKTACVTYKAVCTKCRIHCAVYHLPSRWLLLHYCPLQFFSVLNANSSKPRFCKFGSRNLLPLGCLRPLATSTSQEKKSTPISKLLLESGWNMWKQYVPSRGGWYRMHLRLMSERKKKFLIQLAYLVWFDALQIWGEKYLANNVLAKLTCVFQPPIISFISLSTCEKLYIPVEEANISSCTE